MMILTMMEGAGRVCSASRVKFDLILASVFDFSRGRNARRGGLRLGDDKWSSAKVYPIFILKYKIYFHPIHQTLHLLLHLLIAKSHRQR